MNGLLKLVLTFPCSKPKIEIPEKWVKFAQKLTKKNDVKAD